MEKLSAWLFLVIGVMWLLTMVLSPAAWMDWVATLALLIIGITEVMHHMKK